MPFGAPKASSRSPIEIRIPRWAVADILISQKFRSLPEGSVWFHRALTTSLTSKLALSSSKTEVLSDLSTSARSPWSRNSRLTERVVEMAPRASSPTGV
jgi:hypothetical protein